MISCQNLFEIFKKNELTFFTGVPDSTFKDWMKFLDDKDGEGLRNVIAVNECEASAVVSGYHLATGKVGVVYMQNSGLGKVVNPSTSLLDKEVYSIPAVYMIGWRGEPGVKDEPQHKKMGRMMLPLLDCLEIPYRILPEGIDEVGEVIKEMKSIAMGDRCPVALVVGKDSLEKYVSSKEGELEYEMNREDAIKTIVDNLEGDEVIVSTTGKASRELFEYRIAKDEKPRDFYTVGSMGCASSIGLGVAMQTAKKVFVFDGDGAALMQMGSFATIGHYKPKNLCHIILDNNCYDSTGGQPTVSDSVDFFKIGLACGYGSAREVRTKSELAYEMKGMKDKEGPNLVVVKVRKGTRGDLGRPTTTPVENKKMFMEGLRKTRGENGTV